MNKTELIQAVAAAAEVDRKTAEKVLGAFTDVVTKSVAKGEPVVMSGFVKFERRQTKARIGRNPQTGAAMKISAKKKPGIKPLKAFSDAVAGVKPAVKAPAKKAPAKKVAAKKK